MSKAKNKQEITDYRSADITRFIGKDVEVDVNIVHNVIDLLEKDNTVAFIARYRRDQTGNLDAEKIRLIQESLENVKIVENRKNVVIRSIGADKLTQDTHQLLKCARTLQEVEEIYAPFKQGHKGTLANRAKALGLDKAIDVIKKNPLIDNLSVFVQPGKKGLSSNAEIVKGVQHIIADTMSKDIQAVDLLKNMFENSHVTMQTTVQEKFKNETKYKDYHSKCMPVKHFKPHQVLAINRAEGEKILQVKLNCSSNLEQEFLHQVERQNILNNVKSSGFVKGIMSMSLLDSYHRLMLPKLMRHKRMELTKSAERESVQVFQRNLKRLLLTPPVTGRAVLGIDPGFKHGCKIAVVDQNGAILDTAVLDLFNSREARMSEERLQGLLLTHDCSTIALGNGKASRETENFITRMKKSGKFKKDVVYSIVSEDGASIYSVSQEAQNEMPNLDVNLRSAVSIARRLQNPMLELIKIEPKHLGVGMYQHDIPDNLLKQALNGVLEDCVSLVGIDLNASGVHALKRIAGLNERKAKAIVAWRERNGSFRSREQLKEVRGIGEKTFEQCAGFVRILQPAAVVLSTDDEPKREPVKTGKRKAEESGPSKKRRKHSPALICFNKLDSTSIHPESYEIATKLVGLTKASLSDIGQPRMKEEIDSLLNTKGFPTVYRALECKPETLRFIINGLCQSIGHDIRADFSKPLFRHGVISINDLSVNSQIAGRVSNVTTFGAFVDLGVGCDGLIHTSQIPPRDRDLLGAGDIVQVLVQNVDPSRKRISLKLLDIKNRNVNLLR